MNVVDSSVVLKWLFGEKNSDEALQLLILEKEFYAPEYLRIEVISNITKKVRAGIIKTNDARIVLKQFGQLTLTLLPYLKLEPLAFELSTEYPVTYYDAIFLAVAINQQSNFYTFDLRLKRSVENSVLENMVTVPT